VAVEEKLPTSPTLSKKTQVHKKSGNQVLMAKNLFQRAVFIYIIYYLLLYSWVAFAKVSSI